MPTASNSRAHPDPVTPCRTPITTAVLALASPSLAATVTVKGFLIPFVGAKKVTYSGKLTPGVSGNLTAPSGIIVAFPNGAYVLACSLACWLARSAGLLARWLAYSFLHYVVSSAR